ncbi:hypothetical protein AOZ06_04085 [Kibdelosporangium phytohabitans]|uniref:Uncharacterized protein n=1 Tax=Kibdelosporangium phytohabitans TaxID=860235 RepID=A0A0N9HNY1_9PSEU|nr:hypothetical protein AOZ06_04085 [Kibdelosporangium phytohabitans]
MEYIPTAVNYTVTIWSEKIEIESADRVSSCLISATLKHLPSREAQKMYSSGDRILIQFIQVTKDNASDGLVIRERIKYPFVPSSGISKFRSNVPTLFVARHSCRNDDTEDFGHAGDVFWRVLCHACTVF